jgi:hypothetical protein
LPRSLRFSFASETARRARKDLTIPVLHLTDGDFYELARFDDSSDNEPLDGCALYCPFLIGGSDDALCRRVFHAE